MNSHIRSGQRGGNRNFGLVGAGKGSADRTTDAVAYNTHLGEVNFPRVPANEDPEFRRVKSGRYIKSYGTAQKKYEQTNETWPV
jgi:hypothetical protein